MLGTFVLAMGNNSSSSSAPPQVEETERSWDHFVRKMHSCNGECNKKSRRTPKDSVWLYVGISVLYFFLIAVVLVILLFAPQWKPMDSYRTVETHQPSGASEQIVVDESKAPVTDSADFYSVVDSRESFQGSPQDPLYDIDPRSSIFRGDTLEWANSNDKEERDGRDRKRINSKYFQD